VAGLVYWLDKKYKFGKGRAFALYVMAYTLGRTWIEMMRTDESEMIGGMRLNVWVSILVFLGALAYFVMKKGPQEFVIAAPEGKGFQTVTEEEFLAHKAAVAEGTAEGRTDEPSRDEPLKDERMDESKEESREQVESDAAASKD